MFPMSQDSHTIINCFLAEARRHNIEIRTEAKIDLLEQLSDYDFIAVTTGGSPKADGLRWLRDLGHEIETPVPSLFTFQIADEALHALMGTVVENVVTLIPGTKMRAEGPLLITHWGMSGPAILKLSSYGARLLAEQHYQAPLAVNWTKRRDTEVLRLDQDLLDFFDAAGLISVSVHRLGCRRKRRIQIRKARFGQLSGILKHIHQVLLRNTG